MRIPRILPVLVASLIIGPRVFGAEANLKEALQKASQWRLGESRAPLSDAADLARQLAQTPEGRKEAAATLTAAFQAEGTKEFKDFVSKQLAQYGGEEQAPVLGKLMTNPDLAEMARYALGHIAGPAADKALVGALGSIDGNTRIGMINSLGGRRATLAIPALAPLLVDKDASSAAAAARALGNIGGKEASSILRDALPKAPDDRRDALATASLLCADGLMREGKNAEAGELCRVVKAQAGAQNLKDAAFLSMVRAKGADGLPLILEALTGKDSGDFKAALWPIRQTNDRAMTGALVAALPGLAPERQVMLLAALADRGDVAAAPAAIAAVDGDDAQVRLAALQALARLGGASSVSFLAEAAAAREKPENDAALQSLARIRGADVNPKIVEALAGASPEVKKQLFQALTLRNAVEAAPALIDMAHGPAPAERTDALKALAQIEVRKEFPQLIDLIVDAKVDADREAAEAAASAACRRLKDKDACVDVVLAAMPRAHGPAKASLLDVIGQAGGKKALAAVWKALAENDPSTREAAVRALAGWATPEAMPDLLKFAKNESDEKLRVLALRGYLRLLNRESDEKDPAALLALYKEAMALSSGADEKRRVLSGLQRIQTLDALDYAVSFLGDDEVTEEAALSATEIGRQIVDLYPDQIKAAMQKVIAATHDDGMKKKAEVISSELARQKVALRRSIREGQKVPVQASQPTSQR